MDLNFHEGGKEYKEQMIFDDESNTTEFHVPKHARVPFAVDYLIDHNIVSKTNMCLIYERYRKKQNDESGSL